MKRLALFTLAVLAELAFGQPGQLGDRVERPVFTTDSHWVYQIDAVVLGKESKGNLQWTLLYPAKQGGWVFSRHRPRSQGQAPTAFTATGVTDESWGGRDSSGFSSKLDPRFEFPLYVGKIWKTPISSSASDARQTCQHSARAWESVSVKAGSFRALRIDFTCSSDGMSDRGQSQTGSTAISQGAYWYAPEVQNVVREKFRFLPEGGDATSFELVEFKLGS